MHSLKVRIGCGYARCRFMKIKKKVFVTGGAGYIGSHTCVELLQNGHEVMVFDDLSNSSEKALKCVELITNRKLDLVIGDIRDINALNDAMTAFRPDCIMHFAGLKAVGQSVENPLMYYDINVRGSINLLQSMAHAGCCEIIFSSSATVYGDTFEPPYSEILPSAPVSPYGRTKLMVENILQDWTSSNDLNRAVILRYFNPVGAHSSGLIGEDPKNTPNNLMPLIVQVAQKKRTELSIFGSEYPTRDGTGERDYIHVVDLANGHVKALANINNLGKYQNLNLGSGKSTTVQELITTFETVNNVLVPTKIVRRRPGDVAKSLADPTLASEMIGFKCTKTIEQMCLDAWNWVQKNPNGYS